MDWNKVVPQLSPELQKLIAEEVALKLVQGKMQLDEQAPQKPQRTRTGRVSKARGMRTWDNRDGRPLATPKRLYVINKAASASHGTIKRVHDGLKSLKTDTISYEGIHTMCKGIDPKCVGNKANLVIAHLYREGYIDVENGS